MRVLEKINLKTSLVLSITGILILLFVANIIQPKLIEIKEIDSNLLEKSVKISGRITDIRSYEEAKFQVITINDSTGEIDVTISQILNLTANQSATIIGKVTEYKEDLQIQAEKITLW